MNDENLRDRAAIRDVLVRYFHGADSADKERVRTCFTADAIAKLEGRPQVRGVDAIIDQMAVFANLTSGAWRVTTHFMGSLDFRHLDGASAEAETYAFAFLVKPDDASGVVEMRCLRYVDRLVKRQGDWKIASRLHTLDWSCPVPCNFSRVFAERQTNAPAG